MKKMGYDVIGLDGIKSLRKGYKKYNGTFKYKPKWFWMIIFDITEYFVRNKSERAFQI